jgi:phosphoribosylformylglycinamidine cyclo-ligase
MTGSPPDPYALSGVNVQAGDEFSSIAGRVAATTFKNSFVFDVTRYEFGGFRGPISWDLYRDKLPPGTRFTSGADGIGTKVIPISACGGFESAAFDMGCMVLDDFGRSGCMPVGLANVLDLKNLGDIGSGKFEKCVMLLKGLKKFADKHHVVLLPGETAELSDCVGSEIDDPEIPVFNWAGFGIGVIHDDKVIDWSKLAPGQIIIALRDRLRSNGFSAVRRCLKSLYGPRWWQRPECAEFVREAATPSKTYSNMLCEMNGWFSADFKAPVEMTAIAHLSGGGFKGKFGEPLFERGLSARLDNLWDPSDLMRKVAMNQLMTGKQALTTFNGGQGMLVVVKDQEAADRVIHEFAPIFGIEAKKAGKIVDSGSETPYIRIKSKFNPGEVVEFFKGEK